MRQINKKENRKKGAGRLAAAIAAALLAGSILTGCGGEAKQEDTVVRVGSLRGATTIGLVSLMDRAEKKEAEGNYEFSMVTTADGLLPMIIKGEVDIALVPANVAGILYNKTEGGISVIDINTLGVLYLVSGDTSVTAMEDLKGRTVYLTGKGTVPDYTLQYLLWKNGIAEGEVTLEYKSETAEVAAILAEDTGAVGLLPQPHVTAAFAANTALKPVLDMNAEWDKVAGDNGSSMVTGVTIVRNKFLEKNEAAVKTFLAEHKKSIAYTAENTEHTAQLVAEAGIIAKPELAQKAIPACNITYLDGQDMKQALSGYLDVLFEQDSASVGGSLPGEEFYYMNGME